MRFFPRKRVNGCFGWCVCSPVFFSLWGVPCIDAMPRRPRSVRCGRRGSRASVQHGNAREQWKQCRRHARFVRVLPYFVSLLFFYLSFPYLFFEGWHAIAPFSKFKCTGPGAYDVPSGDRGPQHSLASRHETPKKASETPGVPSFVRAELCLAVLRPAFFLAATGDGVVYFGERPLSCHF